jgi:rhodanese-related sulfurtransferase
VVCGANGPESADLRLPDGEKLALGSLEIVVIATPGHTDDSVSFHVGDHLFTGDALLVRGNGRTDFQNGSSEQLYDSITQRIFTLPDATNIWPAHDYNGHSVSSVREEKRFNTRVAGKSKQEFVAIMAALGLPAPKHLQQAVPANREVGLGIGPEATTGRFAEIDGAAVDAVLPTMRVIDVRERHEFNGELGAIDGALNVPMGEVGNACRAWDVKTPLLLVCRSGRRSRQVCEQLVAEGFENVTNLRGGMLDYRERGRTSE